MSGAGVEGTRQTVSSSLQLPVGIRRRKRIVVGFKNDYKRPERDHRDTYVGIYSSNDRME